MPDLSVEVDDSAAVNALGEFAKDFGPLIERAMLKATEEARTRAQQEHRYQRQTGNLQRAIKSKYTKNAAELFIDSAVAKYGTYIHQGFMGWDPDPFLEEAMREELFVKDIEAAIDAQIDRQRLR